jgi:hypothetical protein
MNNQSISTARSTHKHPTLPSHTNYAYPFSKTKRFPDPAPPYLYINKAVHRLSIPTIPNSRPARQAWVSEKKQIWQLFYHLTLPHLLATE